MYFVANFYCCIYFVYRSEAIVKYAATGVAGALILCAVIIIGLIANRYLSSKREVSHRTLEAQLSGFDDTVCDCDDILRK